MKVKCGEICQWHVRRNRELYMYDKRILIFKRWPVVISMLMYFVDNGIMFEGVEIKICITTKIFLL